MDPPESAVVLCIDEKAQVQALDRSRPMLPMRLDQIEGQTHDNKRHGMVQLYAALEVSAGQAISRGEDRYRSREFVAFMKQLARAYPKRKIHVILDNVGTHRSEEVRAWHAKKRNGGSSFTSFRPTRRG